MKSKKVEISIDDVQKKMTKASIKNLDQLKGGGGGGRFIIVEYGGGI